MKTIKQGDIISYLEMCSIEGTNLQRGMNFRLKGGTSVILMSVRAGAPYADRIEQDGKILIYEGHDVSKDKSNTNPKSVDQPMFNPNKSLTQNGKFFHAAQKYKNNEAIPEIVKVYEKIRAGIWVYNGIFKLIDAWQEISNARKVFKFKLEVADEINYKRESNKEIEQSRLIPTSVKLEVWKRDEGKCILCKSRDNLHFDPIIPYSKGGSSLVAENIQLLCARHNLEKRDKIK